MLKKLKALIAFLLIFQSLSGIFFNYSADANSGVTTEEVCMDDQTPLTTEDTSVLHQLQMEAIYSVGKSYEGFYPFHFHFQSYLESLDRPPKFSLHA